MPQRSADDLKPLDQVNEPDPRQRYWVVIDRRTGETRARTVADQYDGLTELTLHPGVPEDVRIHYETARNLLLYSWYVYRFTMVAEQHAYASVEMALRLRFDEGKKANFSKMLKRAVQEGLLIDTRFRNFHRIRANRAATEEMFTAMQEAIPGVTSKAAYVEDDAEDVAAYSRVVADLLPDFRNELAHGSTMVKPNDFLHLEVCCDIINQLFAAPTANEQGAR